MVILAAACTASNGEEAARIDQPLASPDPLVYERAVESGTLDDPEQFGLPPLHVLQSNPRGVASALFEKTFTVTWTMKWLVRFEGVDAAEFLIESAPATSAGDNPKMHIAGTLGSADLGLQEVAILDAGSGPRACMKEATSPWVCDVDDNGFLLRFLSIEGFQRLAALLRDSLGVPGLTVQYMMMNGTPATCFNYPPVPMTGDTVGLDFSTGGAFCLSPEGVLLALEAGEGGTEISIRAFEYTTSADQAKFKLPIDVSYDQPAPTVPN